ncbi:MAG: HesA/MoeB/ThiF family protein [Bacteroidales bacterium]|nr:HesA/MoeB/ThiF family protein [Bacteroidales bacterium]
MTDKWERYARQLMLKEVGEEGQKKLNAAKVLVVGAGGLGSPVLLYLAGAGVGTIGIVDADVVSLTNLQRQVLYTEDEIGKSKVLCAKHRIEQLNADITITTYQLRLDEDNADEIISRYDLVLSCVDNFSTRRLLCKACNSNDKILIHAAVVDFQFEIAVFAPHAKVDYNALYADYQDDEMKVTPILGTTAGMAGVMQALEAVKIICGLDNQLIGKQLIYNTLTFDMHILDLS